jgi:hypothetical protein
VDEEPPHWLLAWKKTDHIVVATTTTSPMLSFTWNNRILKNLQFSNSCANYTPFLLSLATTAGQEKERSDGDDTLEMPTLIEGARNGLLLPPPP